MSNKLLDLPLNMLKNAPTDVAMNAIMGIRLLEKLLGNSSPEIPNKIA
ncbi:MAG: hypothetical protein WCS15_00655 [Prevotella sp.]|nr:hypothetical protein [Prevotella sp.]MDD4533119.1 hypothetical protein [Prevotella sp.]